MQQIYTLVEKLGTKGDALGKEILNYIAAVGFEMNRNFTAVLEAINKGVAGADSLRDLLEKVLEKQDCTMEYSRRLDSIVFYTRATHVYANQRCSQILDLFLDWLRIEW